MKMKMKTGEGRRDACPTLLIVLALLPVALLLMGAAGVSPGTPGAGGNATNAIANLSGLGTNTTFKGSVNLSYLTAGKMTYVDASKYLTNAPFAITEVVLTNDSRLTDSRAPSGTAGGVLGGTYPNPTMGLNAVQKTNLAASTVDTTNYVAGSIGNTQISASAGIALSKLATDPLARANHTGTQTLSTISDAGTIASHAASEYVGTPNGAAVGLSSTNATFTTLARQTLSYAAGPGTTNVLIDLSTGNSFKLNVTVDGTYLIFTNVVATNYEVTANIQLRQDATGGHAVYFSSTNALWAGGIAPTITTNANIVSVLSVISGAFTNGTVYGFYGLNMK